MWIITTKKSNYAESETYVVYKIVDYWQNHPTTFI